MEVLDYKLNTWSFFDLAMLKLTQLLEQTNCRTILGDMTINRY
jgi:hypothetical protein